MNVNEIRILRLFSVICGVAFLFAASTVFGQDQSPKAGLRPTLNVQPVPNGSKVKFKGVVITRDADSFTLRDRNRTDYQVLLTGETSVKANGGFLHFGKKYPMSDLLRGLIIEVEGHGNAQGQLVAEKIRFNEADMRAAVTTDTRVGPVEENQERLSGQMDELSVIADEARKESKVANERITSIDDYDTGDAATVNFAVNSVVLTADAKKQLDALAEKALNAKFYMIEVTGHTDSTGNEARNMTLSRQRAEAVIEYLAVTHKIPVRRFITPMGFGPKDAVADNKTSAGRAQNRRVEVKVLLNRGLSGASSNPSGDVKQ